MTAPLRHGLHRAERPLVLEATDTRAIVAPGLGGRLASLVVRGSELLVTEAPDPIMWGSFPMVPFAGRIRNGRFAFAGRDYQLQRNAGPHAIHGTVFERAWSVNGPSELTTDLGPEWPFHGRVIQRFALSEYSLRVSLTLEANESMPAALGWHPSFRRVLHGSAEAPAASSQPVELKLDAAQMFLRDPSGIPTGEVVPPNPRPWDDCFTGLRSAPALAWPGIVRLELTSSADYWVAYDERPQCVCVEPQTSIPDFVNLVPATAAPGEPMEAWMEWRWSDAPEARRRTD